MLPKGKKNIFSSCGVGKAVGLKFGRDSIPSRAEDEYNNPRESFAKKHITNRAAERLVKLLNIKDLTLKEDMQKVEKVIKAIKDDKTDVNLMKSIQATMENAKKRLKSDSEFGSKIGLLLKLTCKKCCCVSHLNLCSRDPKEIVHKRCDFQHPEQYPELKQTEFADFLERS